MATSRWVFKAGYNFTEDESGNIDIGNGGIAGENNTIRIGDPTVQNATYIAGIYGATPNQTTASAVCGDANGQLGTVGQKLVAQAAARCQWYVVTNNDTQPITIKRPVRVHVDIARHRL